MRFETRSNPSYQKLALLASLSGVVYLVSRLSDLDLYHEFMLGRYGRGHITFEILFPFLVFAMEIFFVFDHLLFTVANWRFRLPVLEQAKSQSSQLDTKLAPFVSILIPTLNESLEVIRATVSAAAKVRYPKDRFEVLLLDDKGSDENLAICKEFGVRYVSRIKSGLTRDGYKAGNLNFGVKHANPACEFLVLLDADQVCLPSILEDFLPYAKEAGFGFVQAPQTFQGEPEDYWDRPCREFHLVGQAYRAEAKATMLTGTSALVSLTALKRVGGFDETTVTEDLLTGARMQAAGFSSFYHPGPVAYGLVPDTLVDVMKQRLRWSQGAFQFIKRGGLQGLTLSEKLSYLSGVARFAVGFPFLLFALLPPLAILGGFNASLHYSNLTLVLLAAFIITRFLSQEAYFKKTTLERTAGAYLNFLYAHIFALALVKAALLTTLSFWTTPKGRASQLTLKDVGYWAFPLFLGLLNLCSVAYLLQKTWVGGYPKEQLFWDYGGVILLAIFFAFCGLSAVTIRDGARRIKGS